MSNKPYNGYPSYNAWNVSLWISNDEGFYQLALDCLKEARTERKSKMTAAIAMLNFLNDCSITHTPDGVRYTKTNILHALRGLEE